jgi:hypothetical protein
MEKSEVEGVGAVASPMGVPQVAMGKRGRVWEKVSGSFCGRE